MKIFRNILKYYEIFSCSNRRETEWQPRQIPTPVSTSTKSMRLQVRIFLNNIENILKYYQNISFISALEPDEIKCLKNCFDLFDSKKQDFLSADDLDEILRAMGFRPSKEELMDILAEIDEDGSGEIEFAEFCQLCAKFLVEDPDIDTMKRELKDAFRIYDKDGQGFITMDTLRALISELLNPLTDEELDGIIAWRS